MKVQTKKSEFLIRQSLVVILMIVVIKTNVFYQLKQKMIKEKGDELDQRETDVTVYFLRECTIRERKLLLRGNIYIIYCYINYYS